MNEEHLKVVLRNVHVFLIARIIAKNSTVWIDFAGGGGNSQKCVFKSVGIFVNIILCMCVFMFV